ncbi:MAG: glyoxalase [Hyphomicrobiales bacterium]|nr:MAG: glyoxalase [Hyphomicrobiales bacterium]
MVSQGFSKIDGIYETHLPVANLKRSTAFYRDVLGLELAHEFPERGIVFFWVGEKNRGMLGLWQGMAGPLKMTLHFAFRMERSEVLSSLVKLKNKKIVPLDFNGEPVEEPVVIGWMPAVSVYFKDPDGHSIEFLNILDEEPDKNFGIQPYSQWVAKHK